MDDMEAGTASESKTGDTINAPTPLITSVCKIIGWVSLTTRCATSSFRRLWIDYYPQGAFGEEGVIMPGGTLRFFVGGLLSLLEIKSQGQEIKSQGQTGFPFETHPKTIMASVTSILMYGFTSAAEHVIYGAAFEPTSVYAIIARLGRIGSLTI